MRTLIISEMCLLAVLALVGSCSTAWSGCSSGNTGVLGWWPLLWHHVDPQFDCGCSALALIDTLESGAARLQASTVVYYQALLQNYPEPISTLASEASQLRTVFYMTEGFSDGFVGQFYKEVAYRDYAWLNLIAAGWVPGTDIAKYNGPPAPGIYIWNAGISDKLASSDQDRIIGAFACYSYPGTVASWGVDEANGTGTFFGFNSWVNCDVACNVAQTIIRRMGCYGFPKYGHQTDDAIRDNESLVTLVGNRQNQYNCHKSCLDWAVHFLDVCADQGSGTINWAVCGEDPETRFVVRGYSALSAEPKVLLEVGGSGIGAETIVRIYSVPLEEKGFRYFDVVEIDGAGRHTPSDLFTWGPTSPRWAALAAMDGGPPEGPQSLSHEPAETLIPNPDSAYADVVIYSTSLGYLGPVKQHYQRYKTEQGFPIRTYSHVGSSDPMEAREVVEAVIAANENYMAHCEPNCPRDFPTRPILQLVGETMERITFPNDPWGSCYEYPCQSYNLIYDIDDDGYPDGPVAVLPCKNSEELQRYITAVDDWNNNRFVDAEDGTLQLLVGDRHGNGTYPDLDVEMAEITDAYESAGNAAEENLVESAYAPDDFQGMRESFYTAMNNGRRDVWVQGLSTRVDRLTGFVRFWGFDVSRLTKKQRVMILAPACESAGIQRPRRVFPHACDTLLFNDTEKTVAAGFVGLLNGAYEGHDYARGILLDKLRDTGGKRKPMAEVVNDVVQEMRTQFPHYAKGLVFLGAHALSPCNLSTSLSVSESAATAVDSLTVCPGADADSLCVDVTLRNVCGEPIVGESPSSVYAVLSVGEDTVRVFSGDTLRPASDTDASGHTRIVAHHIGGCGTVAVQVYGRGKLLNQQPVVHLRSPDLNADGEVNALDWSLMSQGGPCTDLNWDGTQADSLDWNIFNGHWQHTRSPSIALSIPNGSEWWQEGDTKQISWQFNPSSMASTYNAVDILLSRDGGVTYGDTICASVPNSGSHQWSIPAGTASEECRVKVEARDVHGCIGTGASDENFAIAKVVSGLVDTNSTWTTPVSVAGDVTVSEGTTLALDPGVRVRFATSDALHAGVDTSRCELIVQGTLTADGDESSAIEFSSLSASPQAGDWRGIRLADTSTNNVFDNCAIKHAYTGIEAGSAVAVDSCVISEFTNDGIKAIGSRATIDNSQIFLGSTGTRGVELMGCAGGRATNNTIAGSASGVRYGVVVNGTGIDTVSHNRIEDVRTGIRAYDSSHAQIIDNILDGNASTGISAEESCVLTVHGNSIEGYGYYGVAVKNYANVDLNAEPDSCNNRIPKGAPTTNYCVLNKITSNTVEAENNWWGSSMPLPSYFSGPVDWDPYLTYDPGMPFAAPLPLTPMVPAVAYVLQNYPNPLNPVTTIEYGVPEGGAKVMLRVFDVSGRVVRVLVDEEKPAGVYAVSWNGRGNDGRRVASGVYLCDAVVGGYRVTKKLVVLR